MNQTHSMNVCYRSNHRSPYWSMIYDLHTAFTCRGYRRHTNEVCDNTSSQLMADTTQRYVVTPDMVNTYNTSVTGAQEFASQRDPKQTKVRLSLANGLVAIINLSQLIGQGIAVPSSAIGLRCNVSFFKKGALLISGKVATTDDYLVQSLQLQGHEDAMASLNQDVMRDLAKDRAKEAMANAATRSASFVRVPATPTPTPTPAVNQPVQDSEPVKKS